MRAAQVEKLVSSGSWSSLFCTQPNLSLTYCFCTCYSCWWNNFPEYLPMAGFFRSQPRWPLRGFSNYLISSSYSFLGSLYWIITIFSHHLWLSEITYLLMCYCLSPPLKCKPNKTRASCVLLGDNITECWRMQAQIPAPSLISCLTLGNLLSFSVSHFPYQQNVGNLLI